MHEERKKKKKSTCPALLPPEGGSLPCLPRALIQIEEDPSQLDIVTQLHAQYQ
jgi:hypothetical protein